MCTIRYIKRKKDDILAKSFTCNLLGEMGLCTLHSFCVSCSFVFSKSKSSCYKGFGKLNVFFQLLCKIIQNREEKSILVSLKVLEIKMTECYDNCKT